MFMIEEAYELMKKEYNRQREENISLRLRIVTLERKLEEQKEVKKKDTKPKVSSKKQPKKQPGTVAEKLKIIVDVLCKKNKMAVATAYLHIYENFCKEESLDFRSLYSERLNSAGKIKQSFLDVLRSNDLINKFENFIDTY